ncbi:MAG TPA: glycosyltransferase family 39 protein [Methylomirabilota bacterium]|nr:glycosyltransferase family 39 protein [Methylomirabilota bacterium]
MTGRHRLALAGLLVGLAAVMAVWLGIDRRPPEWDHANHLERAVACHQSLRTPGSDWLQEIIAESSFYPPIVTCAAGLLYFAFPVVPLTAQALIWVFLVVGTLAVFGVGRRLLDPGAGLLAALLFATAPFVVFMLLNFQLDLPLAAMVALALYTLVRTEDLSSRGWALGLGLVLGLGMLTKPPFAAYLSGPLLWAAWRALRAPERRARLLHLLAALGVAAAIALPWYGPRLVGLPAQIINRSFKQAAESGHAPALSGSSLLFYPQWIIPQWGLLATALLLWGIVAVARRPRARGLVWAALAPFVIFVLIQNKNLRYTLPFLPAAALAAAAGVSALPPRARWGIGWSCVIAGVAQVGSAAFAFPPPTLLAPVVASVAFSWPPDGRDWHHRELLDAIVRAAGPGGARVAVVPNDNYFSISNFRYEVTRDQLPLRLSRAWEQAPLGVDFAIVKTGDQGPDAASAKPDRIMAALGGGDPWLAAAYPVIVRVPLPDGSEGTVRMRRLEPVRGMASAELAERLRRGVVRLLADVARDAQGLRVTVGYRDDALAAGSVETVTVEAESALVGEFVRRKPPLRIGPVRLRIRDAVVNPGRLAATGDVELLDVGSLHVERLGIAERDLAEFIAQQRGLSGLRATMEEGWVRANWALPGPGLSARLALTAGSPPAPFALRAADVRYGGVRLPGFLVDWIVRNFDPTPRLRRLPMPVSMAPIRIQRERLEVGEDGAPTAATKPAATNKE